MRIKIFIILLFTLYQTSSFAKTNDKNDFNYKYLSNYFSALLSFDNQKNEKALEFFETSKSLKRKHEKFLKEYVYALVLDGQVKKAITQIKSSRNSESSNFFEAKLLLALDLIGKKKYKQASKVIKSFDISNNNTYELIILKSLENYNQLFKEKDSTQSYSKCYCTRMLLEQCL